MSDLLNLCLVPFKNEKLFVAIAGILAVSYMFRIVNSLIRGNY